MEELSKSYRHKSNPKEKEFHDVFCEKHKRDLDVSLIVFPTLDGHTPTSYINEREKQIVVNTIQWLGSPVGINFLSSVGFKLAEDGE